MKYKKITSNLLGVIPPVLIIKFDKKNEPLFDYFYQHTVYFLQQNFKLNIYYLWQLDSRSI